MKDTYAVLRLSGLQYLVREGDIVDIKKSNELRPEVLLLNEEGKVTVGTPIVAGAKIKLEVEKEFNDKVQVRRYRSKSRHRVTKGFKYPMQRIIIKGINQKAEEKPKVIKSKAKEPENKAKISPELVSGTK